MFGIILARDEKCQLGGLHATTHYQWQSKDEKKCIDFVKIKFYSNESIDYMVWNLKSIQIKSFLKFWFKYIEQNLNSIQFNSMQN